jgi:hypothetical protein
MRAGIPINTIVFLIIVLIGVSMVIVFAFSISEETKGQTEDYTDIVEEGVGEGIKTIEEPLGELTSRLVIKNVR